ncbi:MAG: MATE family efflux transporter [Prevotella sp.]|nr:MATE family efflux transporter [Prevotella sp.]MCM1075316.1 MATE family efflux transporter [Ruminococcus sp.]
MSENLKLDMLNPHRLWKNLILFALPIIGCGVVQQSFNSVDIAVVGQFVGSGALAAVGANGSVISLIITLFMGIALGVNVVISRALGSGNTLVVRNSVRTQALFSIATGIFLTVLGLMIAEPILAMLDTPAEVIEQATLYLKIYALGFPGMMVYNFSSAVLRSIGDTMRPFIWLVIGGIVNIALNLLLVLQFHTGVEGVAIATTISNYVSAIGVMVILMRSKGDIHLSLKDMRIDWPEFGAMVRIGLPAGVQGTLFALSNVVIQSSINSYGAEAMAGNAAALVYELYGYFIISAFVQAAVAFVSINYGAGQMAMCKRITARCMLLGAVGCFIFNGVVVLCAHGAIAVLTNSPEALDYGVTRLHNVLVWQFVATSYEVVAGSLRGLGFSLLPMVVTLLGTCVVRIFYVKFTLFVTTISSLLRVYPLTWLITGIGMLALYFVISRRVYSRPAVKLVN